MVQDKPVTVNVDQRLYVIPSGSGYSCLGFDVCAERMRRYATWIQDELDKRGIEKGYPYSKLVARYHQGNSVEGYMPDETNIERYNLYMSIIKEIPEVLKELKIKSCPVDLSPQLLGLEGKRVEVETSYGEIRRFNVGKSTGFMPIHLEIHNRRSMGGMSAERDYKWVKVIR